MEHMTSLQRGVAETNTSSSRQYDVAILSDFRYPGGTSASVAEEIRAQARAGLSTVLVHVRSPLLKSSRTFNPRIVDCLRDHDAELALPGDSISARVLIIRQPRIFTADLEPVPQVQADEVVMVINQGPRDVAGARDYYDMNEVRRRVERYFGDRVRWVTIGPLVREQVLSAAPAFPLAPTDWHNIIDVDAWWYERKAPLGDVPVIGRHGRPAPVKWPRTGEEISQAYPTEGPFRVRLLGGGELAAERLGFVPETWDILPFGSLDPKDFLRTIDFFVYFHDPDWVEAFGRTILEAMASGVPVIVPDNFRALFQDAALYGTPDEVQGIVQSLYQDWERYRQVATRAREFVDQRFGYHSHTARLADLGVKVPTVGQAASSGHPEGQRRAALRERLATSPNTARPSTQVMMLSSNGAGLGHVTRLMSVARRLPSDVKTVMATQSYAIPVVQSAGYLAEYIPSKAHLKIEAKRWNSFLYDRLCHLVETYKPAVVAVDGTVPYSGLLNTMADHPEIVWVWVRRAMWKQDQGQQWIERGKAFDFILEPGELASAMDQGPTVGDRDNVRAVGPITLLDPDELLDTRTARQALNLSEERPAALLQLGAGNINDISSPIARTANFLINNGYQVMVAQSPIATRPISVPPPVIVATVYPVGRYLRAFDLVVSASGYNSFHELIGYCIPTVFVPNSETALDDQVSRARYASTVGASLVIYDPTGSELEEVLTRAIRTDVQDKLRRRCAELLVPNGAAEAASWIVQMLPDRSG